MLVQELETLEEADWVATPHHPKFAVSSAEEQVPLLEVTTYDAPSANPPEYRQQQPGVAGQLHGCLTQQYMQPTPRNQPRSPLHLQPQHQTDLQAEVPIEHVVSMPQQQQQQQQHLSLPQQQQQHMSLPQQQQHALQSSLASPQQAGLSSGTSQEGARAQQSDALTACLQEGAPVADGPGGGAARPQAVVAAVHDLSCERPDGKLLFQDVSFQVRPGQLLHWATPSLQLMRNILLAAASPYLPCSKTPMPALQQPSIPCYFQLKALCNDLLGKNK